MTGVYLYPGYVHAIIGHFDRNNILIQGKEGIVTYIDMSPFPVPQIVLINEDVKLTFEQPNRTNIANNPLRRDFHEQCYSYLDNSSISGAGEGLFAKCDAAPGTLMALFNGVRIRRWSRDAFFNEWSDYSITLDSEISLDIPDKWCRAAAYCATLGHKTCHSFEPNCQFAKIFHPRFGMIMSVFTSKYVGKGDELLVNYRYPIRTAPEWYRNLWSRYLSVSRGWTKEMVLRYGYQAHQVQSTFNTIDKRFRDKKLKDKGQLIALE